MILRRFMLNLVLNQPTSFYELNKVRETDTINLAHNLVRSIRETSDFLILITGSTLSFW